MMKEEMISSEESEGHFVRLVTRERTGATSQLSCLDGNPSSIPKYPDPNPLLKGLSYLSPNTYVHSHWHLSQPADHIFSPAGL
jgi:hypothetical protein